MLQINDELIFLTDSSSSIGAISVYPLALTTANRFSREVNLKKSCTSNSLSDLSYRICNSVALFRNMYNSPPIIIESNNTDIIMIIKVLRFIDYLLNQVSIALYLSHVFWGSSPARKRGRNLSVILRWGG